MFVRPVRLWRVDSRHGSFADKVLASAPWGHARRTGEFMSEDTRPAWSGFWRRVGAFIVDSLLLGAAGFGMGLALSDILAATAGPTRLIGLAVATLYFGVLSSGVGGSRTLGMRLLGLKVMSWRGRPLGLLTSLWRALLLTAPMILNGLILNIPNDLAMMIYGVTAAVLVFGVGLAQIVLLLFNLPSRRMVHDLLSGSAVVRGSAQDIPAGVSRVAVGIAAVLVLAVFGGSMWAVLAGKSMFPRWVADLEPVRAAVLAVPGVIDVGVFENTTTVWSTGGNSSTRTLVVNARVRRLPDDPAPLVREIGDAATGTYRLAPDQRVRINLNAGFDIGIASGWRTYSNDYQPVPVKPPAPLSPPET